MKKVISIFLVLCLLTLSFAGCSPEVTDEQNKQEEKAQEEKPVEKVNLIVAFPGGPSAISIAKMAKEKPSLGENVEITYEPINSTDVMASKILSGEVDFTMVPTNLIAKLYNKGVKYQLASSVSWGVLYIAGSEDINGWEGLKGKEIYTIGRGLTPDILLRYLLNENGLDPDKDIKINYLSSPQELAQFMIAGKGTLAVIPEPLLTTVLMKNKDVKVVLDLQEEWERVTGKSSYPQTALCIKKDVIDKYPEIVDAFLTKYEESIKWANENPAEAGTYVEELNVGLKAKIAEKSIPGSNLRYVDAAEAKSAIEDFLKVLMDFSAESIGGKLPDDGIYMER